MSEDSQLPAVQESSQSPMRLDDAARAALKEADYDPRIVESVNQLAKIGTFIPRDATPEYIKAIQFKRQEGLRATEQEYENLIKEARSERNTLKKKVKAIENNPEEADAHKSLIAKINKLTSDIDGYAMTQVRLADSGMKNEANMLDLYNKTKKPGPPDAGGSVSWDPDATTPGSVNLQINVGKGESVTVTEK